MNTKHTAANSPKKRLLLLVSSGPSNVGPLGNNNKVGSGPTMIQGTEGLWAGVSAA